MDITLYTIHCPACRVLEIKLERANVDYTIIDDENEISKLQNEHNISSMPILKVNDEYMTLGAANKWLKEYMAKKEA